MVGGDRTEFGYLSTTAVDNQGAAGREDTPGRRRGRTRNLAHERYTGPTGLGHRIRYRNRRQQGLRVRVKRCLEQRLGRGELDDVSEIHHRDSVGDVLHHREVVGHEQVGDSELVLKIGEEVDRLRLDRHIERRDGLVADDQVGAEGERPGDVDSLALTAGEFVGVAGAVSSTEADPVEKLQHPVVDLLRCHLRVDPHRLADDAADGMAGIQRRIGVLEDHLHPRSEFAQLLFAEVREFDVAQPDLPGRRAMELEHSPSGGGFAAPALADQPKRFAREELEAHAIDRLDRFVARPSRKILRHVHDPKHGLSRTPDRGRRRRLCDGLGRLSRAGLSHVVAPPASTS